MAGLKIDPMAFRLLQFTLIYTLLLLPWPLANEAASTYLIALGHAVYGGPNDQRELDFEKMATSDYPYGIRIVIVNRSLMKPDGSGPVRNLDLDARGIVIKPLALLIALIAVTPLSWLRRLKALGWCLLWEQFIIIAVLGFSIWSEAAEISLVHLSPFWLQVVHSLREVMVSQLGLSVPILLWLLVVFRRGDERIFKSYLNFSPAKRT